MKKIFAICTLFFLFACSKSNTVPNTPPTTPPGSPSTPTGTINNSTPDTASFYGVMNNGSWVDSMADYSVSGSYPGPVTAYKFKFNNKEQYSMDPACGATATTSGYVVVMEHFGADQNSNVKITFTTPGLSNFTDYSSSIKVETISTYQMGTVNVSFTMTDAISGSFVISGKVQGSIDSVAFSFKGSFKNI